MQGSTKDENNICLLQDIHQTTVQNIQKTMRMVRHTNSVTNKSNRVESAWFKPSFNKLTCLVNRSQRLVFS